MKHLMKKFYLYPIIIAVAAIILNSCKKEGISDPVIIWNNPADITFGTLLGARQLNAQSSATGDFVYSPPIGTLLEIGANQDLSTVFTPDDPTSYNTATKTVQINVTSFVALHDPSLVIQFTEVPLNHNMHITTDGGFYYTCNGGNYNDGKINKYSLDGAFLSTFPMKIDMRSIMYNKVDGALYVSGFEASTSERNIYKITNLATGIFSKIHSNLYDNFQSATALSHDGQFIYAFNAGTLKKFRFSDGTLSHTLTGLNFGPSSLSNSVVAVDPDYIYTWDAAKKTVYVYDHDGNFIRDLTLTDGSFGYSLSFVNGLLFVSVDGASGTGTWYGYNIRRAP